MVPNSFRRVCQVPPSPRNPTYIASEDVTIIAPTIDTGEEFEQVVNSWLVAKPKEILIITEEKTLAPLQDLANQVDPERVRVLAVPLANKRLQVSHGIRNTTTDIIVFADDDVFWPPTLLPHVLACFENPKVGGVGTSKCVQPVGEKMTVWEVLAAFRLTIRNIEMSSSTHIDGGVSCLSGRTAAYRTVILKDPNFLHSFTHEYWLGKYQLNSDDDNFITRWMVSHGWSTYVQCCKEAELLSTAQPNWRFLKQVLRWSRSTWRSDICSLFMERHIWTAHSYVAFAMVGGILDPLTLFVGPCLVSYLMCKGTDPIGQAGCHLPWWDILLTYRVLLFAVRTIKLLPHLWNNPSHIIYVPAFVLFDYYSTAVMKIYALCTLHETVWGTRAGIGDAAVATAAAEKMNEKDNKPNHSQLPFSNNSHSLPFQDRSSPHHDIGNDPPIYAAQSSWRMNSINWRRQVGEADDMDPQVGYAG